VYAAIKKCFDIIPIRVDDSGDSDIARDETRMWPTGVIGDNDDLELKRFTVLEKLASLNTSPARGTLLTARENTLNQLVSRVRN
jgi:hypothetical protein